MSITLTENAAKHIKEKLLKDGQYLRFGVKESGCTGFRYVLDVVDAITLNDDQIQCHGVTVLIDKDSAIHVEGTEIDFVKEDFSEMFAFNNPKMAAQCGCGESFST